MGSKSEATQRYEVQTSVLNHIWQDVEIFFKYKFTGKHHLPWMRPKEIDVLYELLMNLKPKRCLEWGAGFSTVYFPEKFNFDFEWHSIEHNREWVREIETINEIPSVKIHHVPADNEHHTDPHNDGSYEDYKKYIKYPERLEPFDFVMIDGRARSECVKKAYDLIRDDGIVVLHDANRTHYHKYTGMYKNGQFFLDSHFKRNGMWIGAKKRKIGELINIRKFRKLYAVHNVLMKLIFKK